MKDLLTSFWTRKEVIPKNNFGWWRGGGEGEDISTCFLFPNQIPIGEVVGFCLYCNTLESATKLSKSLLSQNLVVILILTCKLLTSYLRNFHKLCFVYMIFYTMFVIGICLSPNLAKTKTNLAKSLNKKNGSVEPPLHNTPKCFSICKIGKTRKLVVFYYLGPNMSTSEKICKNGLELVNML